LGFAVSPEVALSVVETVGTMRMVEGIQSLSLEVEVEGTGVGVSVWVVWGSTVVLLVLASLVATGTGVEAGWEVGVGTLGVS
jgi:hypothetical protein